jgi:eukaryotic-like serine/threonine-protein kinase
LSQSFNTNRLDHRTAEAPEFEGYQITSRLGVGAGSVIYAVRSKKNNEIMALKHVMRQDAKDKRLIEQVENEYRVSQMVDYPYIRKIYEIKRVRRRLQTREVFLLMEYCSGISLEQSPSRSLLDLLLIFRMVADGLVGMHNAGFLHCDMKPNNIIIAEEGSIRIIDLGQSCPIGTIKHRIQGTPDYIAPEQVRRKPLSKQTDVFNLGATMYWAFTGKHVPTMIPKNSSQAGDRVELAGSAKVGPTRTPNEIKSRIPIGISNLIMECVNKHPQDRPSDMPTVISRLDLLIHMVAGKKPPTTTSDE